MKTPKNLDVLFVLPDSARLSTTPPPPKDFTPRPSACHCRLLKANGYLHTGKLDGVKHFALWPLAQAAESCFGTDQWPGDVPVPQGWIEFDVRDVQQATAELQLQGYRLLVAAKQEPWGQVVTRLLGPEGLLVGITYTPAMRK